MTIEQSVYEKTYEDYLAQVGKIDIHFSKQNLGVHIKGDEIVIPLFAQPYNVSKSGITDPSGKRPPLDICVILSKYLLLCPDTFPKQKEWINFRGMKDSGPLTKYFEHDVEQAISTYFSGKLDYMEEACREVGGHPPGIEANYDLAMQFHALPKVPLIVLYNDADDEFPAACSVLFERRAENYLDAECLAILGRILYTRLTRQSTI